MVILCEQWVGQSGNTNCRSSLPINEIQRHKMFKRMLSIRTKTQSANFGGNPLCSLADCVFVLLNSVLLKPLCVWVSGSAGWVSAAWCQAGKLADVGSSPLRLTLLWKSCGSWTQSGDFVPHKLLLKQSSGLRRCPSERRIVLVVTA